MKLTKCTAIIHVQCLQIVFHITDLITQISDFFFQKIWLFFFFCHFLQTPNRDKNTIPGILLHISKVFCKKFYQLLRTSWKFGVFTQVKKQARNVVKKKVITIMKSLLSKCLICITFQVFGIWARYVENNVKLNAIRNFNSSK